MITDPDEDGYRYPHIGERLWHWQKEAWCTVVGAHGLNYDPRAVDEVPVLFDGGFNAVVKLRNLEPIGGDLG